MNRDSGVVSDHVSVTHNYASTAKPKGGLAWRAAFRVALVAFLAFIPVRDNDFVDWDDQDNFVWNLDYRGLGPSQLKWAWTTTILGVYQPVSWMLLEAEYAGWRLNPRGYHLFSLFLHVANAVALFVLIRALLGRALPALDEPGRRWLTTCSGLAAALFAVHPLRTEVVAWASCQPYLPCALLAILSILAYLRAADESRTAPSRRGWLLGSWLLLAAALLAKAVAVSVPAVLVALDVVPLRRLGGARGWWRDREARLVWYEKLPFFALAAAFLVVAYRAKESSGMLVAAEEAGIGARIALACHSVVFYLAKTLWPFDLNAYYMRPEHLNTGEPRFVLAIAVVGAISMVLLALRLKAPGLLAAWVAYLALLAPNSGLVVAGKQLAADRYSYGASMALSVVAAAVFVRLGSAGRQIRIAIVGLAGATILFLTALSFFQSQSWYNSVTLWSHAIEHGSRDTPDLHNNLAMVDSMLGDHDKAIAALNEALRLRPEYAEAHRNLGLVYARQGRPQPSIEHLAQAVALAPDFVQARADLARVLSRQKGFPEAAAQYEEIVRMKPRSAEALGQLGQSLLKVGRSAEAEARFREALAIDPKSRYARRGLDALLFWRDEPVAAP